MRRTLWFYSSSKLELFDINYEHRRISSWSKTPKKLWTSNMWLLRNFRRWWSLRPVFSGPPGSKSLLKNFSLIGGRWVPISRFLHLDIRYAKTIFMTQKNLNETLTTSKFVDTKTRRFTDLIPPQSTLVVEEMPVNGSAVLHLHTRVASLMSGQNRELMGR